MLSVFCKVCTKKTKIPALKKLLELKVGWPYPFIHYIDCCAIKKVKVTLSEGNGIVAETVDK